MRSIGDIPIKDLTLVRELVSLETLVDDHIKDFPVLSLAKGFTCIAYDYFTIDFEEEGERLLDRAESYCPGYFSGPVLSHIKKDPEFALLMKLFTQNALGLEALNKHGFEHEQV